ncbi:MAG: PQQ-dependent sugar dehydrogenase [Ruminococcaceae bacterium]|nr:PQQ-dependent sugar dehydrogenase [Oscillospiraceae bacterium]
MNFTNGSIRLLISIIIIAVISLSSACADQTNKTTTTDDAKEATTRTAATNSTASQSSTVAPSTTTANGSTTVATSEVAPTTSALEFFPPVENREPETDYTPAFSGQTRSPGLRTKTPYNSTVISDDLKSPWGIAVLPDNRLVITEKGGAIRIAKVRGELSDRITGFPELDTRSQGGLLDVAPAPDFTESRLLYFTFSELTGAGSATAVGRARLNEAETALENFEKLFTATPYYNNGLHFGSRIVFDSNGNLFVSTGERSNATVRQNAQLLDNGFGKIFYLTAAGEPVTGSPWVKGRQVWPEIYSYGHRNVQGLDIHPETGELWASEMGPRGGDELNLIKPGLNYGWPVISYGIEYSGLAVGEGKTTDANIEQPVYYWDPVLAPSGMTFYRSENIPEWENNLFIGGLAGQHISRLVLANNRVVGEERLLAEEGQRFRDLTELDGNLYAITDSGRLYKIGK